MLANRSPLCWRAWRGSNTPQSGVGGIGEFLSLARGGGLAHVDRLRMSGWLICVASLAAPAPAMIGFSPALG